MDPSKFIYVRDPKGLPGTFDIIPINSENDPKKDDSKNLCWSTTVIDPSNTMNVSESIGKFGQIVLPNISGTLVINSSYRASFSNTDYGLVFRNVIPKSTYVDMNFKYIAGYNFSAILAWAPKGIRIMFKQMINEVNVQVLRMYFFGGTSPVTLQDIFSGSPQETVEIFIQGLAPQN